MEPKNVGWCSGVESKFHDWRYVKSLLRPDRTEEAFVCAICLRQVVVPEVDTDTDARIRTQPVFGA